MSQQEFDNFKQGNALNDDIRIIAERMQTLYLQAESDYSYSVNYLIQSKITDEKEIEHLLNYMLDFVDNKKILALYRKLCRYYYFINPQATAEYIQSYKELYDKDEELFKSGYFKKNPI
jgi:hypothetical protein